MRKKRNFLEQVVAVGIGVFGGMVAVAVAEAILAEKRKKEEKQREELKKGSIDVEYKVLEESTDQS